MFIKFYTTVVCVTKRLDLQLGIVLVLFRFKQVYLRVVFLRSNWDGKGGHCKNKFYSQIWKDTTRGIMLKFVHFYQNHVKR